MTRTWDYIQERLQLPTHGGWLLAYLLVVVGSIFLSLATEEYLLLILPVFIVAAAVALIDFSLFYWLLLFSIPLSTELYLPNGLGTDLPTEPLMVGLMLLFGIFVLQNLRQLSLAILWHPITLLLLLHLGWIGLTTLTSDLLFVSVKFLLAKVWYIVTFFGLTAYLVRSPADFRKFFWVFFSGYALMSLTIFIRHALMGFNFTDIHFIMHPFQRNHVSYAAQLSLFFPFLALMAGAYPQGSRKRQLLIGFCFFIVVAVYFSYTRAAYVALLALPVAYQIFRWRLIRPVLAIATIVAIVGIIYTMQQNRYLEYAPNYDRTISHENFDNLIEATYKMEDISTMERLYRWVAAGHMTPERPWLGWGPGNFYFFYKSFTVTSFRTYVSDNPEQSGIHNYYFMVLVEQGVPGLLIFLALLYFYFIRGEQIYHALHPYPERQRMLMITLLSMVVIVMFLLINDLIETDKVGPFFFINMAVLINQELFLRKKLATKDMIK